MRAVKACLLMLLLFWSGIAAADVRVSPPLPESFTSKGGVGTASVTLRSGVTVGALVVVNCVGDVIDPATGLPWTNYLTAELGLQPPPAAQVAAFTALAAERDRYARAFNSTIGVVATDATLGKASC